MINPSHSEGFQPRLRACAFTLVEMLIATAIAMTISAAMLAAMVGLRKTFLATEQYAIAQTGQARLLAYVGRDLRKISGTGAILSPAIGSVSYAPVGSSVTTSNTLTLVIPCFYTSGTGSSGNPIVYASGSTSSTGTMGYGPSSAIATGTIQYFKAYQSFYNSQCYLRVESEGATSGTSTVVEKADGMLLELIRSGTSIPATYKVRVRMTPSFKSDQTGIPTEPAAAAATPNSGAEITATDWVLLRGTN